MQKDLEPDSPRLLCEDILADARRQSEEIALRAVHEAEAELAKARQEATQIEGRLLSEARAEGQRRAGLVLATVPVEAGRLRADRLEGLLESILQEARQRLLVHEGFDYRKAVTALAIDAMRQMPGERFVVRLSVSDCAELGKGLAEDIARGAGRAPSDVSLAGDPSIKGGGVVVQAQAGRQIWDNQFVSRLERMWPELRRQVAIQTGIIAMGRAPGGAP